MGSIFDGITVPGAGITPGSAVVPRFNSHGPVTAGAVIAGAGPTGLVATVDPPEFGRLVSEAGGVLVLHVASPQAPPASANRPPAPARATHRYTFCMAGIVFVTQSNDTLTLPSAARLVECAGIIYEGKPIA